MKTTSEKIEEILKKLKLSGIDRQIIKIELENLVLQAKIEQANEL